MQFSVIVVVLALATGSLAQFAQQRSPSILRQSNDLSPDGSFQYSFQTEDGISADARGTPTNIGSPEGPATSITGKYTYTGTDGQQYTVNYVADENGYRPSGAHLPVAPHPQGIDARSSFQPQQTFAPAPQQAFAPVPQRAFAPAPQGFALPQQQPFQSFGGFRRF